MERAAAIGVGLESYRKIYSDVITPRRVAELLILRKDMPRSLHSCMSFIHETLEVFCANDNKSSEMERVAGELHAMLQYGRTDDIIELGHARIPNGFPRPHLRRLAAKSTSISWFRRTECRYAQRAVTEDRSIRETLIR